MNEKQLLTKANLPKVFVNALVGFASGLLGTMVLGMVLLLTWSVVGEVLSPTNQQVTNEFGQVLSHKENTHPLFLSVIICGVFLAILAATMLQTVLISAIEERYTAKATSITQVATANVIILLIMIPVYLSVSGQYGATGVAVGAMIHCTMTVMMSILAIDILALKRYTLLSLYGVMVGLVFFFLSFNLFSANNPTLLAFVALPLLLGLTSLGGGLTQLVYFWFADTYGNDFLDTEKRFGADYGQAEIPEEVDNFSEEFGEI